MFLQYPYNYGLFKNSYTPKSLFPTSYVIVVCSDLLCK